MKIQQFLKAAVLVGAGLITASASAVQIGPNPTKSSLEANRGPFNVSQFNVSRPSGYGAGTVYYPTNAGAKVGAIAIVPGFLSYQSSINWWGPRLASHGFVVITIDTYTTGDQPDSRSRQQLAALDQVVALGNTSSSPIYGKVDGTRTGVMGWSMGGGGSLISAKNRPSIKAAAPQAPWNTSTNFSSVTVPTLIFGCQSDIVAPVISHAIPFYNSMTRNPKQYLEKTLGDHFCFNNANDTVGLKGVAWMKRFVDGDTRYTSFACSNPNALGFSDFRTARCS
ncbi:dienelactone hydrolase family protein [Piscinibacter gummiphilus]|uniref:Dienelactone hydrolase family protein n=1 Tax=Piscinibacter gummiphilus TaxID=946333 RepID=A0ABZ0CXU2_9BURK|nr:dienelactone hydrolase family protein [Piscinibacter gummiphilus]WOB09336.1 dienelactone hydrolase family protein [Piscinibacter gummiphilus]